MDWLAEWQATLRSPTVFHPVACRVTHKEDQDAAISLQGCPLLLILLAPFLQDTQRLQHNSEVSNANCSMLILV